MLRNSTDVSIKKATVTQCAEPRRFVASRNWGSRRSIAMRRASPDTPTYAVNTAPQSTRHASTQMAVRNASPPSAPATALSRSAECAYTWGSGSTDSAASASRGLNRHTSSHRLRIVDENTRASRSSSTKLAVDSKLGTGGGGGQTRFRPCGRRGGGGGRRRRVPRPVTHLSAARASPRECATLISCEPPIHGCTPSAASPPPRAPTP